MVRHISFVTLFLLVLTVYPCHTRSEETRWSVMEAVDTDGDVGTGASIILDASEKVWIVYFRADDRSIRITAGESHSWRMETVFSGVTPPLGFILDASESPCIIYNGSSSLEYAYKFNNQWQHESICGFTPMASALSAEPDGTPVVAYLWTDDTRGYVTIARRADIGWESDDIKISEFVPFAPYKVDVDVDSDGDPHFCVAPSENSPVQYWRRDGAAWSDEIVPGAKWDFSLALDSSGFLHVAYVLDYLWITIRDAAGWEPAQVTPYPDIVSPDIFISADDTPVIEFGVSYDYGGGLASDEIHYALLGTAGLWLPYRLHQTHYCDGKAVMNAEGYPHFAYYDTDDKDLRYATMGPSTPVESTSWGAVKSIFNNKNK